MKQKTFKMVPNKLRVCHHPDVPCKAFACAVEDEVQAKFAVDLLANQHIFLFEGGYIEDYSNAIHVEMLVDGEWQEYFNEEEMMDFDELSETYLNHETEVRLR